MAGLGEGRFLRSLAGLAVGPGDRIHVLADGQVKVFEAGGALVEAWAAPAGASAIAVGPDGRVYLGAGGRVEIREPGGAPAGGFAAGDAGKPAAITAIRLAGEEVLVADAAARFIRRYDRSGSPRGEIGTRTKTGCFILPNRSLDFAVDGEGLIRSTDTGRHQVSAWALDGSPRGAFGKFGATNPQDFVGCCNPINVAAGPAGEIVTAEKAISRVKVYTGEGRLLAVIGPEHFDPACTSIPVAVDSKGRVLAADPVRRRVQVFARVIKVGVSEPFCEETACGCVGAHGRRSYRGLGEAARKAGVELSFSYFKLESGLAAAVAAGAVDGAIAKAWTVLRAARAAGRPFERICDLPLPDGSGKLAGVFIAPSGSPIRSLADLSGKRLAVGRSESYENSHAVDRTLRGLGIALGAREEYPGCLQAALSVVEGKCDAAVVSSYCPRYGLYDMLGPKADLRSIGETAAIPFVTFALSERADRGLRSRLREALLEARGTRLCGDLLAGALLPPLEWKPEELDRP